MAVHKTTLVIVIAVGIALSNLAACRNSNSNGTTDSSSSAAAVTFTRDIAPILFHECAKCHRPGGSAPFSVLTYPEVRQRARTIAKMTQARFMPPWLPEPGYGAFAGERHLSDIQIETIHRWVEQGAPEGDPAALPPPPKFVDGWRLGQPDLVMNLPRPYTLRADGPEVWRNFVIPIALSRSRYVKTVELQPGSSRIVHHALIGVDPTRSSRRRDEKDVEPGFDGMDMGDSQAPDGHLLGWTPGMDPFPGVEGKAWRVDPGTDLVLQLHLIPSGKREALNPVVGLYFAEAPPVGPPMYLVRLDADHAIDIPPGAKNFIVTDSLELPVDVDVLAVYPHAHFLARTMEAVARLPDGTEQWLLRIEAWNFKWQDVYRYQKPIFLPKGTTIGMRYSYDNSSDNPRNPNRAPRRVVAGLRSSDEMAHLQLQVLPRRAGDVTLLKEALYRHVLQNNPGDGWGHYELANALRDEGHIAEAVRQYHAALVLDPGHAAARNNLAVVLAEQGDVAQAIDEYRQALRFEPDFADAHFNLANALRSTGRPDEAIAHYREALRLEPDFAEAHNNLGELLASRHELDAAMTHFREAIRIKPDSAEAHNNIGAALGMAGRLDEAVSHFRQALEIDPAHAKARDNLRKAAAYETRSHR